MAVWGLTPILRRRLAWSLGALAVLDKRERRRGADGDGPRVMLSSMGGPKVRGTAMEIRYYLDPETGLPHIYGHGVTEAEVERVLRRVGEDGPSSGGSRQAVGPSEGGRYLRVVYVPDEDGEGVFVVTAYPLGGRELRAFRRRKRRRGR